MYIVTFTHNGAPVCHWAGFATYSDARRAIADADLSIPLAWDWRIDAAPDASAADRREGRPYCVEYRTPAGRIRSVRVTAPDPDAAIHAAVTATGCDFAAVQSVEARGL